MLILGNELNSIILVMKGANFIASDNEPVEVANLVYCCLKESDILPKVTQHVGIQLASRCLVAISLFQPAIHNLHERHGAPSVDFYRQVGKSSLRIEGLNDISIHFDKWTDFIHEQFI